MNLDRQEWARVCLFDSLGESTFDEMQRIWSFPELCAELKKDKPYFQIAYRGFLDQTARDEDFDRCCQAVACCRDMLFIVEEVELYCTPQVIRPPLRALIEYGRHQDISIWCASRYAGRIHQNIRSQANRIVSFLQVEPRHLKWIEEAIGPELAQRVRQLKQYESVTWEDGFAIRGTPPTRQLDKKAWIL